MSIEKVIRDGCTAVLITNRAGYGWSTSACVVSPESTLKLIFDPVLINLVDQLNNGDDKVLNNIKQRALEIVKHEFFNHIGASDLVVEWVPTGHVFQIREFLGKEYVYLNHGPEWITA